MEDRVPPLMKNAFRVILQLVRAEKRLDNVLLLALREQDDDLNLKHISRTDFKELFTNKKIFIKGQNARPSSSVAKGTTYVDIVLK
ncbi:MAG: hypothetical protein ACXWQQ_07370 [Pseudobdellovibrio sp.]